MSIKFHSEVSLWHRPCTSMSQQFKNNFGPPQNLGGPGKGESGVKKLSVIIIMFFSLFCLVTGALAAQDTANLTVNAAVGARAKLTLGVNTINFPDEDPDLVASIPANENAVNVNVKVRTDAASTSTLTHKAGGDLVDGGKTITIDNVTWTATGAGYVAGTMSTSSDEAAGSWDGPGNFSGTFSYFLANSWDYEPGSYTASSTYTLTAP
jgi:hypothetical protein